MELVTGAGGNAAPRLNDVEFTVEEARDFHQRIIAEVVPMLCAGVIHGDLSEFNILAGADGPVIIDLPQAVDAAGNNPAQAMLERDISNLRDFFGRFAPEILATNYGGEIWAAYEAGQLTPATPLTGPFARDEEAVDLDDIGREIRDIQREEAAPLVRIAQSTL